MSLLATPKDTPIDSRVGGLLLVAVLSFALGIFASLAVFERPQPITQKPCPVSCPRPILMSYSAASDESAANGVCDVRVPPAFADILEA